MDEPASVGSCNWQVKESPARTAFGAQCRERAGISATSSAVTDVVSEAARRGVDLLVNRVFDLAGTMVEVVEGTVLKNESTQ